MGSVAVRYIVDDIDESIEFYRGTLGFELQMRPGPGFAALVRDDLRLLLNTPTGPGGASQPMPDGRRPQPGGWARFQLAVDDLDTSLEALRAAGATLRSGVLEGPGGRQVVVDDPSGNAIELFEPGRAG